MNREYVIVSMKQSNFPFLGCLVYWGRKRTADIEKRTFGGYTFNLDKAERYTLEEIMDARKDLHLYEGGGMKEMENHENVIIKVDDLLDIDSFITATVVYRP